MLRLPHSGGLTQQTKLKKHSTCMPLHTYRVLFSLFSNQQNVSVNLKSSEESVLFIFLSERNRLSVCLSGTGL